MTKLVSDDQATDEAADFRKGIDGLAALCRQRIGEDRFGGAIFVFRNRRGTSLKLSFL